MKKRTNYTERMRTGYASKCIPVIIAAALLASCSGEKKEAAAADEKVKVKVEAVHIEDVEQLYEFTATVTANASNRIAPQAPARIEKLHVEVGDRVKAGQLLATMDATTLNQLKIQMENQEIEFNRVDELYKVGGVSKSAWDAQKAQLDISRNTYKNLEENNKLASPVSGVVTARNYDNGDMYNGATPVYVVEQFSPVKLMVNVSESYYTKVAKGMDVDIRLDVYAGETFSGKVFLVYPTIDAATRTFPVEIRIPNNDQRVRPGMFARVVMNFGTIRRVVASDRAVVKQPGSGDRYMYVCRDGRVSYNKVELGRRMGDRYEVVSGVEDGDQVVVTGLNRLTDGQEVIVVR